MNRRPTRAERDAAEQAAAAERWRKINAETKAAGCFCGQPATHVRRYGGTIGGVPMEVWTCEAHQNVSSWYQENGGPWVPVESDASFSDAVKRWRT